MNEALVAFCSTLILICRIPVLLCVVNRVIWRENMKFLQLLYLKHEDVNLFLLF